MAPRIPGVLGLAALVLIITTQAIGLPAQTRTDLNYQLQKVKEWRTAAMEHIVGKPDQAAVTIAGWPSYDLESVIQLISKLATGSKSTLSKGPYRRSLDLTDLEVKKGDLTRILKKGILLHTDVALLELEKGDFQHKPEGIEGMGIFSDGRVVIQPLRMHWHFARQLIELMSRMPAQDALIRQWYISTTAHMGSQRLLGYSGQNLTRALDRFPSDDKLLFYSGALHEIWASPVNQNPILPKGARVLFGSRESELRLAQQHLQKSIEKNPGFPEARLRLGRVLGLQGDHKRAVEELQSASAAIDDRQLSYYASLFLGNEFRMISRPKDARECFERAAVLYPEAQSPLLALSQLALDGDDFEGALAALKRVFALHPRDGWNDDPWWVYDLAHVRNAEGLVEELQKMFGELPK